MINEKKDASLLKIVGALGALLVMLFVGIIFVRAVYHRSFDQQREGDHVSEKTVFPQPQPGHFTAESLAKLRSDETKELHATRWSNDDHSEAQVTIERALEIYEAHHAD